MGIRIYTDGHYNDQDMNYAWAFVVVNGNVVTHYGYGVGQNDKAASMRNVAGELSAAMHAAKWAKDNCIKQFSICHDYEGVGKWCKPKHSGGWEAKNEFSQMYQTYMKTHAKGAVFHKVNGHSGDVYNEFADQLAGTAIAECASRGTISVISKYENSGG